MNETQFNGRMAWLGAAFAAQRDLVAKLFLRLKDMGLRAGTSLDLHRKFMQLMEQIAFDQEKERDILCEIEAVEKKHLEMKQMMKLRRADDAPSHPVSTPVESVQEEPKRDGVLALLGLWTLFSAKPVKHKNQSLTAD